MEGGAGSTEVSLSDGQVCDAVGWGGVFSGLGLMALLARGGDHALLVLTTPPGFYFLFITRTILQDRRFSTAEHGLGAFAFHRASDWYREAETRCVY